MTNPTLNQPLLNKFLNLLKFSFSGYCEIEDEDILELIKIIDSKEDFWHVEGRKLYPIKEWRKDLDRIARERREKEEIDAIRDVRMRAIRQLQYKLAEEFGLEKDHEEVIKIAVNILKKNKKIMAAALEVDISDIPDMPIRYMVIDGKTEIIL